MMKKLLCLSMVLILLCTVFTGFAEAMDPTEAIIAEFEKMTQIPRPSGYTDGISEYLAAWASERGFAVVRDETNNVIFDVPATTGMEDKPVVGLQVHMDMVFAQTDGNTLDPYTTPITMINDGKLLTAKDTSLGADDGIGVAIALCIADGKMAHGPLRVFVTSDEETTFEGVQKLDAAFLKDVPYLINLDSEDEGHVTVSSAAGIDCVYTAEALSIATTYDAALEVTVNNLSGGHSGLDIGKNRLNAIIGLGKALNQLEEKGIPFGIASMKGGFADNAIPTSARATICVAENEKELAIDLLTGSLTEQLEAHRESDPNGMFTIEPVDLPTEVMIPEQQRGLLGLVCNIKDGCLTMSSDVEGLIQTSSNLGILDASVNGIEAVSFFRSSDNTEMNELLDDCRNVAEQHGQNFEYTSTAEPWEFNPNSKLLAFTKDAYTALFGTEISVDATHAGLECGCFVNKNPDIDIVSIGPTVHSPHTINESCEIESFDKVWMLVEEIFRRIE